MTESRAKSQATRQRNLEARSKQIEEKTEAKRIARLALERVMENQESTPAEILEAARLLVELSK